MPLYNPSGGGGGGASTLEELTGITATTADVNKLAGSGAVVASGTTTLDVESAQTDANAAHELGGTYDAEEISNALNAIAVKYNDLATKHNALLDAIAAFDVITIA